jgi:hypothetical protein
LIYFLIKNIKQLNIFLILYIKDVFLLTKFLIKQKSFEADKSSNLIVSLTSYPARIDHAWIAIESIFQQDLKPWKVVLVLSDEEFPTHSLPPSINRQVSRGLEILWTKRNTRSFKKLLPTRERYPNATIVTMDDDIIYEPWRLRQLVEAAHARPDAIIGHRGWVVTASKSGLEPYATWPKADLNTPESTCFLTTGGGTLFPPHILPDDILFDIDLALRLCPLADDIWLWAVARKAGVSLICLGNHKIQSIKKVKLTSALSQLNLYEGQNDVQLAAVIEYFKFNLPASKALAE